MRRLACVISVVTLSLAAAGCSSTPKAAAVKKTGTETFYGTTASTASHPTIPLKATGLFASTGSIHLTGGSGKGKGTLKLARGTLAVEHSGDHNSTPAVNKTTCVAVFSTHGTFTVLSGTGAYKGYTGHGTFRITFGGTLPRIRSGHKKGQCNLGSNVNPVKGTSVTTFTATGPLTAR